MEELYRVSNQPKRDINFKRGDRVIQLITVSNQPKRDINTIRVRNNTNC